MANYLSAPIPTTKIVFVFVFVFVAYFYREKRYIQDQREPGA